ncbi:MAG: hypothetical protein L0027_10705 [Candidatus Rokubacteria bacterium]|nr:hypothetical protein [Candidatus Rokubacteria bacterium]
MDRRRQSRHRAARARVALVLLLALGLVAGCASAPPRRPLPAEVAAAAQAIELRWQAFGDLRSLVDIRIKRGSRTQQLSGVLLLKSPTSLRFEALSPLGPPILVVGSNPDGVTIWEVLQGRAFLLSSSPDANRRWLGLALGAEDLVALLSGNVRPMPEPVSGERRPPDEIGPSIVLTGRDGVQRTWLDPTTSQPRQVEWTGGKNPARVTWSGGGPDGPPTGLTLATPNGDLTVSIRYRNPELDSGFDPELLTVKLPQGVKVQDFR